MKKIIPFLLLLLVLIAGSCSKENSLPPIDENLEEGIPDPLVPEEPPVSEDTLAGSAKFLKPNLVDDNYILVNDAGENRVFLMDKNAVIRYEWELSKGIGNDAKLLPNGQLLAILQADKQSIALGGQGGVIQLIENDGSISWNFEYSEENYITHHDVELLPNGNVLSMVWERKTTTDALDNGSNHNGELFPEAIIEINPATNEIVWEWHSWDHLIQDLDADKANYGVVADSPQLIDINYVTIANGDIMHANGIAYDETKDIIYLSVNFYSEVWVIDHSTTTEQAATNNGGTYGKGGDLLYRFGNPEAHQGSGTRIFNNNHFPNLLDGEHDGNMLIFSNGGELNQSTVFELGIPNDLSSGINAGPPEIIWSFTHPDLYSAKVSGAVLLPNGNRLITEGDYGFWEVTQEGEIVWKFKGDGFYWRAYHYDKNSPEILGLNLK